MGACLSKPEAESFSAVVVKPPPAAADEPMRQSPQEPADVPEQQLPVVEEAARQEPIPVKKSQEHDKSMSLPVLAEHSSSTAFPPQTRLLFQGRASYNSTSSAWEVLTSASNSLGPSDLVGLVPSRRVVEAFGSPTQAMADLTQLSYLSRGASCLVFRGVWQSAEVAVKLMTTKGNLSPQSPAVREALLGCELSHPNCVTCYAARCVFLDEHWISAAKANTEAGNQQQQDQPDLLESQQRNSFDSGDGFGPPPVTSPAIPVMGSSASMSRKTSQAQSAGSAAAKSAAAAASRTGLAAAAAAGAYNQATAAAATASPVQGCTPSATTEVAATVAAGAAGTAPGSPSAVTTTAGGSPLPGKNLGNITPDLQEEDLMKQLLALEGLVKGGGVKKKHHHHHHHKRPKGPAAAAAVAGAAASAGSPHSTVAGPSGDGGEFQSSTGGSGLGFELTPMRSPWADGCTWAQVLKALKAKPGYVLMIIIQEYCDMGSLSALIHTRQLFLQRIPPDPGRLPLRALLRTVREVAMGLNHLHEAGVIHGDLKPGNVVLSGSRHDRRGFTAKLTDLGLSRVLAAIHPQAPRGPNGLPLIPGSTPGNTEQGSSSTTSCFLTQQLVLDADWGTTPYMAPEHFSGVMVKASDIYSLGVMIWEMAHSKKPFSGLSHSAIAEGVMNGRLSLAWDSQVPPAVVELALQCMAFDPAARPSCAEVITSLATIEMGVRDEVRAERAAAMSGASNQSHRPRTSFQQTHIACDQHPLRQGEVQVVDAAAGYVIRAPVVQAGLAVAAAATQEGYAGAYGGAPKKVPSRSPLKQSSLAGDARPGY